MALKLEVFILGREVLSRIIQDIDLYTSAKFRAFSTNLNNPHLFCTTETFPVALHFIFLK